MKWKYHTETFSGTIDDKKLELLGGSGWELAGVTSYYPANSPEVVFVLVFKSQAA